MTYLLVALLIVAVLVIAILNKKLQNVDAVPTGNGNDIKVERTAFLSRNEAAFYTELRKIIPAEREISCKSRLEDLMNVPEGTTGRAAKRNRIKSRHIDFVVWNPANGYSDYAIELDDSSHNTPKRQAEDQFKDALFTQIQMPLIRIKAKKSYDCNEICEEICQKLGS